MLLISINVKMGAPDVAESRFVLGPIENAEKIHILTSIFIDVFYIRSCLMTWHEWFNFGCPCCLHTCTSPGQAGPQSTEELSITLTGSLITVFCFPFHTSATHKQLHTWTAQTVSSPQTMNVSVWLFPLIKTNITGLNQFCCIALAQLLLIKNKPHRCAVYQHSCATGTAHAKDHLSDLNEAKSNLQPFDRAALNTEVCVVLLASLLLDASFCFVFCVLFLFWFLPCLLRRLLLWKHTEKCKGFV